MDPGESRQVRIPNLQRKISISSILDPDSSEHVAVYEIPRACPPLTGPRLHHQPQPQQQQPQSQPQQTTIQLAVDDYQYDYFYLNQNSQIYVELSALRGSTNVYLFRGNHILHHLQEEQNCNSKGDEQHWRSSAIIKRFISNQGSYSSAQIHYQVPYSDTYVLVYDNASSKSPSALSVNFDITLTTYNLQKYLPVCNILSNAPCILEWKQQPNPKCVLFQVQTTSSSSSAMYVGNNPVTIQIQGESRRWYSLILYSSIPLGIAILIQLLSRGGRHNRWNGYHRLGNNRDNVPDTNVAVRDIESDRPPPAEAPVQPSAPPIWMDHEEDYGSIPIVEAEYIAPIAPPYLLK
jgi:hypothetical protein